MYLSGCGRGRGLGECWMLVRWGAGGCRLRSLSRRLSVRRRLR